MDFLFLEAGSGLKGESWSRGTTSEPWLSVRVPSYRIHSTVHDILPFLPVSFRTSTKFSGGPGTHLVRDVLLSLCLLRPWGARRTVTPVAARRWSTFLRLCGFWRRSEGVAEEEPSTLLAALSMPRSMEDKKLKS